MADASSRAVVVASLEANSWSIRHFDLVLHNTGNGPAFDVEVKFDPELPSNVEGRSMPPPFQKVSIIRPGQELKSYIADFPSLDGKKFLVTASWRRSPKFATRDQISYSLDMASFDGIPVLGSKSPQVQIAQEIKNIRNDWRSISGGIRKIQTDVYTAEDRKAEHVQREIYNRSRKQIEAEKKEDRQDEGNSESSP